MRRFFDIVRVATIALVSSSLVNALGQTPVIGFTSSRGSIQLAGPDDNAIIVLDGRDWPGVIRAGKDLAADFGRVTGTDLDYHVQNTTKGLPKTQFAIIIGTIGKSAFIDGLIAKGDLDVSKINGTWESYTTQLLLRPATAPGIHKALIIAGSDKRGTIFGAYDISEQIGVSPWYWWADVPTVKRTNIYALDVDRVQKSPSVKYRGLFLNDEQPALTGWVNAKFPRGKYGPGFNKEFHSKVFELLLRLRANYFWPTTWNSMFAVDDPENQYTADYYGIVMGASHTEPMASSTKEWNTLGNGTWDFSVNDKNIVDFWYKTIRRAKPWENLITMAMRGNGDTALDNPNHIALLERVISKQRQIIDEVFDVPVDKVPQMWCLYKEVQGYPEQGLSVPEDITFLWADDNWGNVRRLPIGDEPSRKGGAGVYYHFDYVGDPRDYKWIDTVSLAQTYQQMKLSYDRGADRIWIVNVGDLKTLETPIDFWFALAYNVSSVTSIGINGYLEQFAAKTFGSQYAKEIAGLLERYSFLTARRKYELLESGIYSVINYREAETVLAEWKDLSDRAEALYSKIPAEYKPAFFQLVSHKAKAGYIVHDIYINIARNQRYAAQRRNSANYLTSYVQKRFQEDFDLQKEWDELLDGKWIHFLDQTHFGYNYWQQPMRNTIGGLSFVQFPQNSLAGALGVAGEGSNGSIPGDDNNNAGTFNNNTIVLPVLDTYNAVGSRWIEIFNKGNEPFNFTIKPHNPWIKVSQSTGTVLPSQTSNTDIRVELSVDWANAPAGYNIAFIDIESSAPYGDFNMPSIHLPVSKTAVSSGFKGFAESSGYISIEAEHATRKSSAYEVIPGFGRTKSGVQLKDNAASTQSAPSGPALEYDIYTFSSPAKGTNITAYLGTGLNNYPGRPLRYAIAIDDETPKVVKYVPDESSPGNLPPEWLIAVANNIWTYKTTHTVAPGKHTLKFWALEPGVVLEKLVIDQGSVVPSYLGPPESKIL
ncbi:hypothetical protein TWF569_005717 [Orbilia oligospora]|uniref:Gylcosyl hydrolase 115 C-terminal domain-containing protein n=1 Tax=Orbilia oligospora TaxID=2813651 RepID=A0A7C8JXX8_ORBOL|nr:hypothetical protein TWF102_009667 [Orbilia oligospora]KAF3109653.1 hypothetical protein TWF103_005026 [Orbilia oligospora]KAF3114944.1 hypothetical protein TWF706_007088 [Orbilia oligospora]KAF3121806.1 hypothetical protein TWF594_003116 [Orbilia oligospora]KAF3125705.1 hypothetical protein TWF703_010693 [Orbilia oligospora]